MKIPRQLQHTALRFYLVSKDGKIPLEKEWNTTRNYTHDDVTLKNHKGNYGVVCGIGNLIVMDVDDVGFADFLKKYYTLPETFTVRSATKKLPHFYYFIKEEMCKPIRVKRYIFNDYYYTHTKIRKIMGKQVLDRNMKSGIVTFKTVMDIQAERAGVVAPGSTIGENMYEITKNVPIATISLNVITNLFNITAVKRRTIWDSYTFTQNSDNEMSTFDFLNKRGILQTHTRLFKCPFHGMHGIGNLAVLPGSGSLYCFHEQKFWRTVEQFQNDLTQDLVEKELGKLAEEKVPEISGGLL